MMNKHTGTKCEPLQTPLERVTAERAELMEKIDKLENFLDSAASKELPLEQVELLRKQSKFMDSYSDILSMRVDLMRKHEAGYQLKQKLSEVGNEES